jgi:hypothetical protein
VSIKIKCPDCEANLEVVNPSAGAWVDCASCGSILVLQLEVKPVRTQEKRVLEKTRIVAESEQEHFKQKAIQLLSQWLDLTPEDLNKALALLENEQGYEHFQIPKGESGRFRDILAPAAELKTVQRRILDRFLYRIQVSNAAHGFIPSRSIVTNARFHLTHAKEILNIDLKDAFPTVNKTWVKHLFVRHTKIPLKHMGEHVEHEVLNEVIDFLVRFTTYRNELPQGAPTSGYLLNIACIKMDKQIYKLLSLYSSEYRYTRYADDITISSADEIVLEIRQKIQKIIRNCGFILNPEKLRYLQRAKGQMLEVTGLVLEKGKVRIPRQRLDKYRALLHHAYQSTPDQLSEPKKLEIQSVVAFIAMVYGRLPSKIWLPYQKYLEKHKVPAIGTRPKTKLDMYLNKDKDPHIPSFPSYSMDTPLTPAPAPEVPPPATPEVPPPATPEVPPPATPEVPPPATPEVPPPSPSSSSEPSV